MTCPMMIGLTGVISEIYLSFEKGSYLFILIFEILSHFEFLILT